MHSRHFSLPSDPEICPTIRSSTGTPSFADEAARYPLRMGKVFVFGEERSPPDAATARVRDVAAQGVGMPRTLPRDPAKRQALIEVGERPERLGPPADR
jgi:hypothetical protein